jgi:hypothetical protein
MFEPKLLGRMSRKGKGGVRNRNRKKLSVSVSIYVVRSLKIEWQ